MFRTVTRPIFRSPWGSSLLVALALLTGTSSEARSQEILDCDQPICIGLFAVPTDHFVSQPLQFTVAYRLTAGEYVNGITIELDPGPHLAANHIGVNLPWTGTQPLLQSQNLCSIDSGTLADEPWDVYCEVAQPPVTLQNNGDVQTFSVTLMPQIWATPKDYVTTFHARIRADMTGHPEEVVHEATRAIRLVSEANPMIESGLNPPIGHPYYPFSQGLRPAVPSVSTVGRWANPNAGQPGEPDYFEGIPFYIDTFLYNRIPPRHPTNDDGDLYDPSLADPAWFDPSMPRNETIGGSRSLEDFTIHLSFPSWARYLQTSGLFNSSHFDSIEMPALGTQGAPGIRAGGVLRYPVGMSRVLVSPFVTSSTAQTRGNSTVDRFRVHGFIPCDVLATLDTNESLAGVQFADDVEPFQLTVQATSATVDAFGDPGTEVHEILTPPYNPFWRSNNNLLPTSCPGPGIGASNSKSRNPDVTSVGTNGLMGWAIQFFPLANQPGGYDDIAILDFVPPMSEFRLNGTTVVHNGALGEGWFCILPRPPVIPSTVWTDNGWTYDPDDDAWFNPLGKDMTIPFEPAGAGLGWNATTREGCLRAAQICDHPTVRGDHEGCVVDGTTKLALAEEITAVMFRSDADALRAPTDPSVNIDGWRHPAGSPDEGLTPPPSIYLLLRSWVAEIEPYAARPERTARTVNHARFYGGSFEWNGHTLALGDGALDLDDNGTTDIDWRSLVAYPQLIDNNLIVNASYHSQWKQTVQRGELTSISTTVNNGGRPYIPSGLRFELELPAGWDPASRDNTLSGAVFAVPLEIGANPMGIGGPLAQAIQVGTTGWTGTRPTLDDFETATATFSGDALTGQWTIAVTLKDSFATNGWSSWGTFPLDIFMVAREGYPFVTGTPYRPRIRATALDYDRQTDDNFDAFPDDPEDWTPWVASRDYFVSMSPGLRVAVDPTCVEGHTAPAFDFRFLNTGGVDLYGVRAVFSVPETVAGRDVFFDGISITPSGYPAGTSPVIEVRRDTNDAFEAQSLPDLWETFWTPADGVVFPEAEYSDVKLVRIRFGGAASPANLFPAWYSGGTFRIDLAMPAASPDDIGVEFSTSSYIGADQAVGDDVPLIVTEPSANEPFTIGQCPTTLTVTKFYDATELGVQNAGEAVIPAWDITMAVDPGDSAIGVGVDNSTRTLSTDAEGKVVFDVWPGQVPTLSEELPEDVQVEIPGYDGTFATLAWSATTPGGATQVLPMVEFDDGLSSTFGNTCTCNTSTNLCVSAVCEPPATGDGEATCIFTDIGPDTCESPTEPLCSEPTGACDPATGQCAYPELPCGPDVATKIYVPVGGEGGFLGTAVCDVTHGADGAITSVTCRTRDEGGVQVLDLIDAEVCGP